MTVQYYYHYYYYHLTAIPLLHNNATWATAHNFSENNVRKGILLTTSFVENFT